jgi:hypothetical protein
VSDELNECYVLLGVAPTASAQELKAAYRDLAKVWHPDRFSHDPRLQQKAQEKLKAINEAYDLLTSGTAGRRRKQTPSPCGVPHETAPPRRVPRHFILAAAAVFGAAFFAASMFLFQTGERPRHASTSTTSQTPAAPDVEALPPGGADTPVAGRPARKNETAAPQASRETRLAGDTEPAQETTQPRPLKTVTVTVDQMSGLLATPDCLVLSRMTYFAGKEPRQYCDTPHRPRLGARPAPAREDESRLKSFTKRLSPSKWFGGRKAPETGGARDVQPQPTPTGNDDRQNR